MAQIIEDVVREIVELCAYIMLRKGIVKCNIRQ